MAPLFRRKSPREGRIGLRTNRSIQEETLNLWLRPPGCKWAVGEA
jgi:hypothetical protein